MSQPLSVTTDLERQREQREYERTELDDERKGRLWYRNCRTGCPAFASCEQGVTTVAMLREACAGCELLPGPSPEANMVNLLWNLPDGVLKLDQRPYWQVAAISYLRAINRVGF